MNSVIIIVTITNKVVIDMIKEELKRIISQQRKLLRMNVSDKGSFSHEDILSLSQELDKLILKHMELDKEDK
ncbi:Spo0E like sporulation regulatory protein [Selenihalanaerobacter shriftii]|uniref:Spo0E like sporulation regulatory protein n=2 Tax=Selenihalanaerobacter shriftii TaxID=142842 RepID=A0A1T4KJP3_9FIRM|nr:Spo0E like sporulation regulatory protein [Selenihalanaerobacter shriftii]